MMPYAYGSYYPSANGYEQEEWADEPGQFKGGPGPNDIEGRGGPGPDGLEGKGGLGPRGGGNVIIGPRPYPGGGQGEVKGGPGPDGLDPRNPPPDGYDPGEARGGDGSGAGSLQGPPRRGYRPGFARGPYGPAIPGQQYQGGMPPMPGQPGMMAPGGGRGGGPPSAGGGGGPGGAPGGGPGGGLGGPGLGGPGAGLGGPAGPGAPGGAGPGGAGNGTGEFLQGLQDSYGDAYKNALNANKGLYDSILQGYHETGGRMVGSQQQIANGYGSLYGTVQGYIDPMQQALDTQRQEQGNVQGRYDNLGKDVLSGIQGIDASQRQAITDSYAQAGGSARQSMISRGLGNTTVQDAVQRGLQFDKSKAHIALTNQTQALTAGYQSQLGLAGAGYAGSAIGQNTAQSNAIANARSGYGSQIGLSNLDFLDRANQQRTNLDVNQYNWMGQTQIPYPNVGDYASLANAAGGLAQGGYYGG